MACSSRFCIWRWSRNPHLPFALAVPAVPARLALAAEGRQGRSRSRQGQVPEGRPKVFAGLAVVALKPRRVCRWVKGVGLARRSAVVVGVVAVLAAAVCPGRRRCRENEPGAGMVVELGNEECPGPPW